MLVEKGETLLIGTAHASIHEAIGCTVHSSTDNILRLCRRAGASEWLLLSFVGVAALDDRLSFAVDTAATLAGAAHAETTLLSSVTNKSAAKPEGPLPFEVS